MEPAKEASLEPSGDAVKEPKSLGNLQAGRPRFARLSLLLQGWELGAITVGLVLSTTLLAVPRAATPGVFPVPLLDVADARAAHERTAELAAQAEREGLPFETRAVGDAVRRLGVVLAGGAGDAEHLQRLITERVLAALRNGQLDALLRLRAVQARMFVRALRAHEFGAPVAPELAALGGDFVARATRNGWLDREGCVASDDELEALFSRRWVDVTRLRDQAQFKPSLGELRRYYRFLLLHPERPREQGDPLTSAELAAVRLRYVEALARRDTEYPVRLARGSLLAEMGNMPRSAQELSEYLSRSGGASFNLRARNYLIYAASARGDDVGSGDP
jgi:hypothetical protein